MNDRMAQDRLTLEEGQVVFQYPRKLSSSSVEYLETWLQLQIKIIKAFSKKKQLNEENPRYILSEGFS